MHESPYGYRVVASDILRLNKLYARKYFIKRLLSFASKIGHRYTFFVTARAMGKDAHLMRRLRHDGHEIACHGFLHLDYLRLSIKEIERDVFFARKECNKLGLNDVGFRPPFLSSAECLDEILSKAGFSYLSSYVEWSESMPCIPVIYPTDWDSWVIERRQTFRREPLKEKEGVYLVHPWILPKNNLFEFLSSFGSWKDLRIGQGPHPEGPRMSVDLY